MPVAEELAGVDGVALISSPSNLLRVFNILSNGKYFERLSIICTPTWIMQFARFGAKGMDWKMPKMLEYKQV